MANEKDKRQMLNLAFAAILTAAIGLKIATLILVGACVVINNWMINWHKEEQ